MTAPPLSFWENASTARARAERDPGTRARIAFAHELVGRHRAAPFVGRLRREELQALRRVGLTLGEAQAGGLVSEGPYA